MARAFFGELEFHFRLKQDRQRTKVKGERENGKWGWGAQGADGGARIAFFDGERGR
jgi:hypothetical protein